MPPASRGCRLLPRRRGLANAAKHSEASQVTVRVRPNGTYTTVEIVDDGIGGADPEAGSGLRGLADRVAALGGELEAASELGRGTALRANLPRDDPSQKPSGGEHRQEMPSRH
ncbi:MAG: ATP-binding protein [Gaiellaceae bacterium]